MSLAAEQYYANPGNDFWKLVGAALNQSLVDLPYQDRIRCLMANSIGLWDAYHSCVCPGSMGGNITEQLRNDFSILECLAPNIRLVCFNGREAAETKESLSHLGYYTELLPSSSGANPRDQEGRLMALFTTHRIETVARRFAPSGFHVSPQSWPPPDYLVRQLPREQQMLSSSILGKGILNPGFVGFKGNVSYPSIDLA